MNECNVRKICYILYTLACFALKDGLSCVACSEDVGVATMALSAGSSNGIVEDEELAVSTT